MAPSVAPSFRVEGINPSPQRARLPHDEGAKRENQVGSLMPISGCAIAEIDR